MTTTETYVPEFARTRKCNNCGLNKDQSYYSMQPGLFDEFGQDQQPMCNLCRLIHRAFLQENTEWMAEAACFIGNDPVSPRGHRYTLQELDRIMFPKGLYEMYGSREYEGVCSQCPVKDQCGEYGEKTGSQGVWGGVFRPGEKSEEPPEGEFYFVGRYLKRGAVPDGGFTHTCEGCQNEFRSDSSRSRYCNEACRKAHRRKEIRDAREARRIARLAELYDLQFGSGSGVRADRDG